MQKYEDFLSTLLIIHYCPSRQFHCLIKYHAIRTQGKVELWPKDYFIFWYKSRQVVSFTSRSFYPRWTSLSYPVPEVLGSKVTTDAVGDRKLSAPARNLTHFLGLGASTLLTAILTCPDHYSRNCSKIIWIKIPYSNNIFYSFSLQAFRVPKKHLNQSSWCKMVDI